MKIFDQHVHSKYSPDSNESLKNYVKHASEMGLEYFIITDHVDFDCPFYKCDWIFDPHQEAKELQELQKQYPNVLLQLGAELGYKRKELQRLLDFKNSYNFDLINLSVHEYDGVDFYQIEFYKKRGIKSLLDMYFRCCLDAVKTIKDYDVFCHFDFAFKTAYAVDNTIKIYEYEDYLIQLFKIIIEDGKVLEINTKVQEIINDVDHIKYFLRLYKSLGGTDISLSSDAHKLDRYMSSFDRIIPIIKECGFNELCYFVHRKKYKISI